LQNQSVLYRQKEGGQPEVFLDPNSFSADGTTSLTGLEFTKDGSMTAYTISEGGSDWNKLLIMDAATKQLKDDTLFNVKFSGIAWKQNDGFYYSSYDKPQEGSQLSGKTQFHKLFYHKLGTPQRRRQIDLWRGSHTQEIYWRLCNGRSKLPCYCCSEMLLMAMNCIYKTLQSQGHPLCL
jgi:prolyl oligopeptidase